ncbi:hypothetical protein F7725_015779 [Dissostichus mawsoni]|uniref:Hcy-binding domain-containing protein n=1 Tax=Dissostichus mawsoni TaxID=36200 RepID=A0A7J5YIH2_DISMA|nr:hypothetical protein F7725_015779 [Dissostichus mawsoni]
MDYKCSHGACKKPFPNSEESEAEKRGPVTAAINMAPGAKKKRGYVKAGPWTPEAAAEHPEAVRQLHREFLRAGSNVMQTFTFYASDDKLENRGNTPRFSGQQINEAACDLAGRWPMREMLWWQGESLRPLLPQLQE